MEKQKIITETAVYNLKSGKEDSENFYADLKSYTDLVITRAQKELGSIINKYKNAFNNDVKNEDILLDVLILGVVWEEYAGISVPFLKLKKAVLALLFELRKYPSLKKSTDILRGKLSAWWLAISKSAALPEENDVIPSYDFQASSGRGARPVKICRISLKKRYNSKKKEVNLKNLLYLIKFLEATCEFKEELKRSSKIIQFLNSKDKISSESDLKRITEFALWFKSSASYYLSPYTSNIAGFLNKQPELYKGREDFFFCGRKESEYHLNMVGAEIMNRTLRGEFNNTDEKILLLPTCMAIRGPKCEAKNINGDLHCTHCNPGCNISQATISMRNKNIRTVLIRHSSSFSKWLKPWAGQKKTGLIGVACVLNLLTGGYEMKRLGIPSQCIFLDRPGCKKHWMSSHPSEINLSAACKTGCKNNYSESIHH